MKTRKYQEGQAIVEMTVGMIGMAAIFCGFLLVAQLTTNNIENVLSARGSADENANTGVIGDDGKAILFWDDGEDSYQYSPDDIAMQGTSEDSNNFKMELVVQRDDADPYAIETTPNYVDSESDFKNLLDTSLFLNAANLTSGTNTTNVSLDDMPLANTLFLNDSGASTIQLQDSLYMPIMQ